MTDAVPDAPRPVITRRREFAVILVLSLLAVSMIAVASATNSYVPLFVAWMPYLAIPLLVSRLDRARAAASPALPVGAALGTEATDERTEPADGGADAGREGDVEQPKDG